MKNNNLNKEYLISTKLKIENTQDIHQDILDTYILIYLSTRQFSTLYLLDIS